MATESKQIDGVVDDPENGGLKSGPCLIAGFHALSCTYDVLRDAQRAADAWNRDHTAPQRTYRGRAR